MRVPGPDWNASPPLQRRVLTELTLSEEELMFVLLRYVLVSIAVSHPLKRRFESLQVRRYFFLGQLKNG
jgi:hypothetical protein